jgi:hypothetical protein
VVRFTLQPIDVRPLAWHDKRVLEPGHLHFDDDAGYNPDICLVVDIAALRDTVRALPYSTPSASCP